jgi:transcriptional regulator NrdR family protein
MKVTDDGFIISCPSCHSRNMIKKSRQKNYDGSYKQRYKCKDCGVQTVNPKLDDIEIVRENIKLAKQKQSAQDTNRIERKAFREQARYENAITKLLFDIQSLLQQKNFSDFKFKKVKQGKSVGVLQI